MGGSEFLQALTDLTSVLLAKRLESTLFWRGLKEPPSQDSSSKAALEVRRWHSPVRRSLAHISRWPAAAGFLVFEVHAVLPWCPVGLGARLKWLRKNAN